MVCLLPWLTVLRASLSHGISILPSTGCVRLPSSELSHTSVYTGLTTLSQPVFCPESRMAPSFLLLRPRLLLNPLPSTGLTPGTQTTGSLLAFRPTPKTLAPIRSRLKKGSHPPSLILPTSRKQCMFFLLAVSLLITSRKQTNKKIMPQKKNTTVIPRLPAHSLLSQSTET